LHELTCNVNIVSVSPPQLDRVLDAAYVCFVRHGVRKTTMEDIATIAGMSRPAVYQYVKSKDDAYRRVAGRLYGDALARARAVLAEPAGTLTQRLDRVLGIRLELLARIHRETPHAAELVGESSRVAGDLDRSFRADLADLLTAVLVSAAAEAELPLGDDNAREVVELALALTRGLEADLSEPDRARDRLRNGIALLIAGLSAAVRA
jgi:AcrR family transcriptional regulator